MMCNIEAVSNKNAGGMKSETKPMTTRTNEEITIRIMIVIKKDGLGG